MIPIKSVTECTNIQTSTDNVQQDILAPEGNKVSKEIEHPLREIDEPPSNITPLGETELVKEKISFFKWSKNMNFIYFIVFVMVVLYISDIIITKGSSSLKEPLFDTLKTLLFTVAGYVFAKNVDT